MIGQTISHYEVLEQLGSGAMGVVYKGRDIKLDRFVALKFLSPHLASKEDTKKRFMAEAQAASALDHPNIGVIHEIDETPEHGLFIVMAYYDGETLDEKMSRSRLDVDEAIDIATQVAAGLSRAHKKNIVHRDIKPANLMVTRQGLVKVVDFGLARMADLRMTASGHAVGTPAYMSPEQIRGGPVDARVDIWSLGVVLHEMLTGRLPFKGPNQESLFYAILSSRLGNLALPPAAPRRLDAVLRKALAKNVQKRYRNIDEMAAELERAGQEMRLQSALETQTRIPDRSTQQESEEGNLVAEPLDPVQCSNCGLENASDLNYCGGCGWALGIVCQNCGASNETAHRFCGQCGETLTGGPPLGASSISATDTDVRSRQSSRATADSGRHISAERRQLTIVSCRLVDAGRLAESLDPEDLHDLLRSYQETCAEVIRSFEGHPVEQSEGGVMACFGFPKAHEDDSRRAVDTALAIVDRMPRLTSDLQKRIRELRDHPLCVGLGLHTGPVVVDAARSSSPVIGQTPSLATRIQEVAEPNEILLSSETSRLVRNYYKCDDLGPRRLAGSSSELTLYRVVAKRAAEHAESPDEPQLDGLVGRRLELDILLGLWERSTEGTGQTVWLSGETGIGKSRLVRALEASIAVKPHRLLKSRCSPYFTESALYPFVPLLQRAMGFSPEDEPAAKLEKLESTLRESGLEGRESAAHLASFLSLPGYPPLQLSPIRLRQKLLETILQFILGAAARQPLLLVLEDLHWADPTTRELIELLIAPCATAQVLIFLTSRPDFVPAWTSRTQPTHLNLTRLSRREVESLVTTIAAGKTLPPEVVEHIALKTDGVPLYVEELTKTLVESDLLRAEGDRYELRGSLTSLTIPTTLQESLMVRLDRLGAAKEVAQIGAALGREFSFEMIEAVTEQEQGALRQELNLLVKAELLYQRGVPPRESYIFKHALVQDTAYGSLLKSTRQQLHQKVVGLLEDRFRDVMETRPELYAHHCTEAGLFESAIGARLLAAQQALRSSATREAHSHLQKGLTVLKELPAGTDRDRRELALQSLLGPALAAIQGYASTDVERAYARASELAVVGDETQQFWAPYGLWNYYLVRAELDLALTESERILADAEEGGRPEQLYEALYAIGSTRFYRGEILPAREPLERGLTLETPELDRATSTLSTGLDVGVKTLGILGQALWQSGLADQGLARSEQALELANKLGHPFSRVLALLWMAWIHRLRGEPRQARKWAIELLEASRQEAFFFVSLAQIVIGWADVMIPDGQSEDSLDDGDAGARTIEEALQTRAGFGDRLGGTQFLASQVEAFLRRGLVGKARPILARAFRQLRETKERLWEAELFRLRGELALKESSGDRARRKAESSFERSIAVARSQNARSLELRTALSWARLMRDEGRADEAKALLEPVTRGFTEGFDTPDFEQARSWLEKEV